MAVGLVGLFAVVRKHFTIHLRAGPTITLTAERSILFGILSIISASLTLLPLLLAQLALLTVRSDVLGALVLSSGILTLLAFGAASFLEYLQSLRDKAEKREMHNSERLKRGTALSFDTDELTDVEEFTDDTVICLGDDGEIARKD